MKVTLLAGLGWTLLLNFFPNELIQLFNHEDEALAQATIHGIQLHLFALALDGFIMLASIYFTSVNQPGKALSIALGNMFIQLPFLYLLPKFFGLDGVWLAMPVSNIVLFLIVAPMLFLDLKQTQNIFQKSAFIR
jgi:Na+-driven multidrug efflux pump